MILLSVKMFFKVLKLFCLFFKISISSLYHILMTNIGVAFGASLFRFTPQICPVCEKSAPFYARWYQNMMAATAGIVKSKFQAVSLRRGGPVVSNRVDIQVVYEIACTCYGFNS